VAGLGDRKAKLIGETPLKLSSDELSEIYGGTGPVSLEFKKDGFSAVKTIITDIAASDLTLNMDLVPSSGLEDVIRLNSIMDSLFESQRLARVGRGEDALIRLKSVEKEAPHLAAIYEIEGGIYYLQKKYKNALDAYSLAASYNPKNPDVMRMRNYLQTALGVIKPVVAEPGPTDKLIEGFHSAKPATPEGLPHGGVAADSGLKIEGGG
jgi:tetratricopeptide (TPR) repeat protein